MKPDKKHNVQVIRWNLKPASTSKVYVSIFLYDGTSAILTWIVPRLQYCSGITLEEQCLIKILEGFYSDSSNLKVNTPQCSTARMNQKLFFRFRNLLKYYLAWLYNFRPKKRHGYWIVIIFCSLSACIAISFTSDVVCLPFLI